MQGIMRKLLYIGLMISAVCSCAQFDDSSILDKLKEHAERIAELERVCLVLNGDIAAQKGIIDALADNDYVTGVSDILEDGKVVGYTIHLAKGGSVNIYDGKAGADGMDGGVPGVAAVKAEDGEYYWTIDGEWAVCDGARIPVNGTDGADGADGTVPAVKVENGFWWVSYDGGVNWQKLYSTGGEDGADGDTFFVGADLGDEDFVVFTFADGQQVKLPTWKAFEELQLLVNRLNTNVSSLQTVLESLQGNDYVTEIRPLMENGAEVGYVISFAKGLPVTVYHGVDGVDGAPGADGEGADAPVISVKKDFDGTFYWTVNGQWMLDAPDVQIPSGGDSYWVIDGEWILDENGDKVPAAGVDGRDGVTPQLKIEGGEWYVSFDNGRSWSVESLGPVAGVSDETIFADITFDENYLYLVLKNGETISVPRYDMAAKLSYSIEMKKVTYCSVRFEGNLGVSQDLLPYSRVAVYYSDAATFSIFNAQCVECDGFEYNGNFSITIGGLKEDCRYSYCICVEAGGKESYGDVLTFETKPRAAAVLDLSAYEPEIGYLTTSGLGTVWQHSYLYSYQIPLAELGYPEWISITANAENYATVAFFSEKPSQVHNALVPPFAAGWPSEVTVAKGTTKSFDVPFNAEYLYLLYKNSAGADRTPALVEYDCASK